MNPVFSNILENINTVAAVVGILAATITIIERPRDTTKRFSLKNLSIYSLPVSISAAISTAIGEHFLAMSLYIVYGLLFYIQIAQLNTTYNPTADFKKLKSALVVTPFIIGSVIFNAAFDMLSSTGYQVKMLHDLQKQQLELQKDQAARVNATFELFSELEDTIAEGALIRNDQIKGLQDQIVLISSHLTSVSKTQANLVSNQASFVQIFNKITDSDTIGEESNQ